MDDKHEQKGFDGTGWAARLSQTFASLVDEEGVTYHDLWAKDASRMMKRIWEKLYRTFNVVIAVEKDSLFLDFERIAKSIGAPVLISGKGKQSKAATELMLREHFGWAPYNDPFSIRDPLVILTITDWDMDGEAVISPTFAEQCKRYTPWAQEVRVGIRPLQVGEDNWEGSWYDVKTSNRGYITWADNNGLFVHGCFCGRRTTMQGTGCATCEACGDPITVTLVDYDAHGLEVEALPTQAYHKPLALSVLEAIPFECIIGKLRDECQADHREAARKVLELVVEGNESLRNLTQRLERLKEVKEHFEAQVLDDFEALGEGHRSDWRDLEDDPEVREFVDHAVSLAWQPWRPFSQELRTEKLAEWLASEYRELIDHYINEEVE